MATVVFVWRSVFGAPSLDDRLCAGFDLDSAWAVPGPPPALLPLDSAASHQVARRLRVEFRGQLRDPRRRFAFGGRRFDPERFFRWRAPAGGSPFEMPQLALEQVPAGRAGLYALLGDFGTRITAMDQPRSNSGASVRMC